MNPKTSLPALAALAVLGSLGGGAAPITPMANSVQTVQATQQAPVKQVPAQQDQQRQTKRVRVTPAHRPTRGDLRRSGPGWTNRHVKRLAVKARNVKRNRTAQRRSA